MKLIKVATASMAMLLLSACINLGPSGQTTSKYVLTAASEEVACKPVKLSIGVMPMMAVPPYDGNQMLYQQANFKLSPYARHAWVSPPTSMLSSELLQSLQASECFTSVVPEPNNAMADLMLDTKLLAMYQDTSVSPNVVVLTVQATLSARNGKVLGSSVLTESVPTHANTPEAGVTAASQASGQLLEAIQEFVMQHAAS